MCKERTVQAGLSSNQRTVIVCQIGASRGTTKKVQQRKEISEVLPRPHGVGHRRDGCPILQGAVGSEGD